MKICDYSKLLIKYETLKHEDKKQLNKIRQYEIENKTLKQCLLNEEKRTKKFRTSYRELLNDYEELARVYEVSEKEKESLKRKIKKLEKEIL